ncbi:MAG: hypothetical protein K8R67_18850 [Desulfobacteraceae bacterium]|nr:hypothetical protein [Desulfobacteraceae bacterium]
MIGFLITFIKGPLIWISFIVFGGGLIVQTFRLLKLTQKKETRRIVPDKAFKPPTELSKKERFLRYLMSQRVNPLALNICLVLVSFIFHVCLIMTPIFVLGHNVMLDTAFGISFFSLPEQVTDIMTKFVIAGAIIFLMRRLLLRRVRIISTVYDYLLLLIAVAPFVTGFMVFHHVLNYNTIILLHVLCGELLLMMIPFSKFFHMVFFFISRFMIISEHSLGNPKRSWHY